MLKIILKLNLEEDEVEKYIILGTTYFSSDGKINMDYYFLKFTDCIEGFRGDEFENYGIENDVHYYENDDDYDEDDDGDQIAYILPLIE